MDSDILKIIDHVKELVSIESHEDERDMAENVEQKLKEYGLKPTIIASSLKHPSVICHVTKPHAKKTIWMETALDTTPPGNTKKWQSNPLITRQDGNLLYGLGISDSKLSIALYSMLAKRLSTNNNFKGNLFLGFDAREQSGEFLGIKDVLPHVPHCDACVLGYQDYREIHIGARGFLRMKITTLGKSVHTGSRRKKGINAIHNMNIVIANVLSLELKNDDTTYFDFGNSINISMIEGGYSINIVPDTCSVWIDIRLTPDYEPEKVLALIQEKLKRASAQFGNFEYKIEPLQAENAYISDDSDPFITLLQKNATNIIGQHIPLVASGPASVGNLISSLDIPIINAFGVLSGNVHAPEEWIDISTIEPVLHIWEKTLIEYCEV